MKMAREFALPPGDDLTSLLSAGGELVVGAPSTPEEWPDTRPDPLNIRYTETRVDASLVQRLIDIPGVVKSERSELTHAFRMLRSLVLPRMRQDGHQVLAVTSPRAIQGKSITAINIATIVAADLDSTALLVDGDLQERVIQRLFGMDGQPGLAEHLQSGAALRALLVNPAIARLVLLPASARRVEASAELLASRSLAHTLQELRSRYPDRIIVVDLPPLLESADALAFMPLADTSLMVVEEHTTSIADLERSAELLAPFNLLGTVMTARPERADRLERNRPGRRRWWPFRLRRGPAAA